jgi:hypothetical protein
MFENSSKLTFFLVFRKKNHFFSNDCSKKFPVHDSFSKQKKSQLAEYDIVGIFAENLVEIGYVWWVDF